jgi:hypothetical protein
MKCAYCNKEITPGTEAESNRNYFCNTLHRYSWTSSANKAHSITDRPAAVNQPLSLQPSNKPSALRKTLFGILYTVILFFLFSLIFGGIVGPIAGMEAGYAGKDPSEAGRIAGQEFGQKLVTRHTKEENRLTSGPVLNNDFRDRLTYPPAVWRTWHVSNVHHLLLMNIFVVLLYKIKVLNLLRLQ